MAAVLKTFGVLGLAHALLLLAALLPAGARADTVTTSGCKARVLEVWHKEVRVRDYPTDSNATAFMMDHCGLSEINPNEFTGLPNLETIYLQNNNIESMNPAIFRAVVNFSRVWLQFNKVRELPVFAEHSCMLSWLIFARNQLTTIINAGTFAACANLTLLDLSYNQIEFIQPNVFSPLTVLEELLLNSNKITFIHVQMFASIGNLRNLALNNNRLTHLPPDFGSSLKRTSSHIGFFLFHDNPWHCACLLELMADVQRAGVDFRYGGFVGVISTVSTRTEMNQYTLNYVIHYDGTRPECNYIGMHPCYRPAHSGLLRPAPRPACGGL